MPAPGNRAGACSTNQQAQRQVLPAAETRKVFAVGRNNGRGLHKNADGKETTLDARFTQLIHMRASAKEQSQQGRAAKLAARRGIPAEEPAQVRQRCMSYIMHLQLWHLCKAWQAAWHCKLQFDINCRQVGSAQLLPRRRRSRQAPTVRLPSRARSRGFVSALRTVTSRQPSRRSSRRVIRNLADRFVHWWTWD